MREIEDFFESHPWTVVLHPKDEGCNSKAWRGNPTRGVWYIENPLTGESRFFHEAGYKDGKIPYSYLAEEEAKQLNAAWWKEKAEEQDTDG
jgi:hypothetical protein